MNAYDIIYDGMRFTVDSYDFYTYSTIVLDCIKIRIKRVV